MTATPTAEQAWMPVVRFLTLYTEKLRILRLIGCQETPARWVLLIFPALFLVMAYLVSAYPEILWLRWVCGVFTAYIIADYLLANTAIAYVTRSPKNPLRSVILTLGVFANVALGFSVWHALQASSFAPTLTFVSAIYFSFTTIATVGYGDITPRSPLAQLTVVSEIMVGVYLLAVILAVVTGWAPSTVDTVDPRGR